MTVITRLVRVLGSFTLATLTALIVVAGAAGAQDTFQDTDDQELFAQGQEVYNASCAGCHGVTGLGGAGRNLVGIATEQPDRMVHINSVINGKGSMPAYGDVLEPQEIDAAVAYLRLAFIEDEPEEEAAMEEPLTELPSTGAELWIAGVGAGLLAAGLSLRWLATPRFRTVPIEPASRRRRRS